MRRVIYILWRRQVKRFIRNKARLVGSIAQPLLMIIALGAGFSGLYEAAGETDYLAFIAGGIIATNIMMSSFGSGMDLIRDKEFGFIKEYLVAPVRRIGLMIGKTLGSATIGFLQGGILLVICIVLGIDLYNIISLPLALVMMIGIAVLFTALGLIFASLIPDFQGFQILNHFLIMPLMMLSGAFYPLATALPWLQMVARFNPLAYGVDGIRRALTGESFFGVGMDLTVLSILGVIFLLLGAYTFGKMKVDN